MSFCSAKLLKQNLPQTSEQFTSADTVGLALSTFYAINSVAIFGASFFYIESKGEMDVIYQDNIIMFHD